MCQKTVNKERGEDKGTLRMNRPCNGYNKKYEGVGELHENGCNGVRRERSLQRPICLSKAVVLVPNLA